MVQPQNTNYTESPFWFFDEIWVFNVQHKAGVCRSAFSAHSLWKKPQEAQSYHKIAILWLDSPSWLILPSFSPALREMAENFEQNNPEMIENLRRNFQPPPGSDGADPAIWSGNTSALVNRYILIKTLLKKVYKSLLASEVYQIFVWCVLLTCTLLFFHKDWKQNYSITILFKILI